jgi:hypothetical protein
MNFLESKWLGERLAKVSSEDLFPLLNVGSSTLEFRTNTQSYIEENIFAPLRARGGRVIHLDIKPAPGVDLVGDLFDPVFLKAVSELKVRSVILSNVLEHVKNRQEICDVVMNVLQPGGYLFVTGPHRYPYHPDPIDTMFRPSIDQVHALFPESEVVEGAIIDSGNWRQWNVAERGRPLARVLVRLLLPFYRPLSWWELMRQAPYIFFHISAFAVVLRKIGTPRIE